MKERLGNLIKGISKDKKSRNLMLMGVLTLLLVIIGATYAYFAADLGGGTNANINASTGTTDSLTFDAGDPIRIHATLENFAEGMESLKGNTTATATLKANNTTNQATGKYNIFFVIDGNDFVYSTEDGQAELILKVTDPNGKEVEEITGLKRVENGFDITTRTGGFLILADYEIETTSTTEQTWNIEVTLVNLDSNQNANNGKSLHGRFYITTEQLNTYELAKINSVETNTTYNSITANLNTITGSSEIEKYYYAIEEDTSVVALLGFSNGILRTSSLAAKELNYIESEEPTHTFDNLKPNTSYKVYSYAKDKQGINSNVYETNITTNEYVLPKVTGLTHTSELYKITVTATSEGGSNEVSKYYFSKDNGATWSEGQESPTYVFDNLLDTTTYNIKVRVSDTENKYSTEYYEAIATSTYINPSISTVTSTKTYNSITLTATASKGTNEISKYYFSIDNGSTWTAGQATNVYTYTGLSENTTYNIKVKVEDTIGRQSNEYTLDVTTNTYVVPTISNVTVKTTYNSIELTTTAVNGDGTIKNYFYSKDNGSTWTTAQTSNVYKFNNLTYNVKFYLKVKAVDTNGRESSEYALTATTDAPVMSTYIKGLYTSQGSNGLYYHNSSLANSAGDNSYRYAGANPSNYVCFGSTAATCPTDNLYRIIGVFGDQVKLIKYDYATSALLGIDDAYQGTTENKTTYKGTNTVQYYYHWNTATSTNTWSESNLNKINLNTNYLNNIGSTWIEKIATTNWKVGGGSLVNIQTGTAKTAYQDELVNNASTTYNAKIGLMYANDYYYAASPTYWTYKGNDTETTDYRSAVNDNWMYMGGWEWTISRVTDNTTKQYTFRSDGNITNESATSTNGIRPTFYLTSSVTLKSGNGTKNNPWRIIVNNSSTSPSISNVTYTGTETSITVTAVGKAGSSAIGTYYFSKDNGATWKKSEAPQYTFSGLTSGTTYSIKVKIADANGIESSVYSLTIKPPTATISSVSATSYTITVNATATKGTNDIAKYMYSINDGVTWETVSSSLTSNSYTITVATSSTTYIVKLKVVDSAGVESAVVSKSVTTSVAPAIATYIKSLYTSQGSNGIYYHDSSLAYSAGDNSYRYAGADPDNYVCFGSTASTCPRANLYRIIGVFGDQVKLISESNLTTSELGEGTNYSDMNIWFYWSGSSTNSSNSWANSTLNLEALNKNYLNYLGTNWSNMIANTTWYVGGITKSNALTTNAKTAYNYEVGANRINLTYKAKVGLLYISDYYYAAPQTYWSLPGNNGTNDYSSSYGNSWLNGNTSNRIRWTITKSLDNNTRAFYVYAYSGAMSEQEVFYFSGVSPTFYLLSTVKFSSGKGTRDNPYRIAL